MLRKFKIESGVQLLARLTKKTEIGNFYPHLFQIPPKNGDIIEISCDSGTPLLIDIISDVLVSHKLNGKEIGILFFNTDGNFNTDAMLNIIKKKINLHKAEITDLSEDAILHDTLSNFHILEINDATQLYTTIYKLENILVEYSSILLLVFDTLTAFYWSEQGFKITKMDSYVKNLLQIIQKVTKEYKVTCLYTRPHYFNSNKDSDHIESWVTDLLNYRIEVTKSDEHYEVSTRTNQMKHVKHFNIAEGEVKWLT